MTQASSLIVAHASFSPEGGCNMVWNQQVTATVEGKLTSEPICQHFAFSLAQHNSISPRLYGSTDTLHALFGCCLSSKDRRMRYVNSALREETLGIRQLKQPRRRKVFVRLIYKEPRRLSSALLVIETSTAAEE